jgi:hypothetical protein
MDDAIKTLIGQGYTPDEAALVLHVVEVQTAERAEAIRTGLCKCGAKLRALATGGKRTLECGDCNVCHAA